MIRLDDRVLAAYTRWAHWAQRVTGRTCYWFAQQCAILLSLRLLASPWVDRDGPHILVAIIASLGYVIQASQCAKADREFQSNPSVLPSLAVRAYPTIDRGFRLSFLVLSALIVVVNLLSRRVQWVGCITGIAIASLYYLQAVVPMPPAAQRDRVRRPLIPQGAES